MSRVASELAQNLITGVPGLDTKNLYISVRFIQNELMFVEYKYKDKPAERAGVNPFGKNSETLVVGDLEAQTAESNKDTKGPCLGAFVIRSVAVRPRGGWGRLLYYIAMHFAGKRGITADKIKSSPNDVSAWNKLYADSEVKKRLLDDINNPQTPEKEDDCNLASSGIYGHEKSKDSFDWNRELYGGDHDADTETPEEKQERLKKGEEYRKTKASKLNYVYYGTSEEAINALSRAGKIIVNEPELKESVKIYDLLFRKII